MDKFFQQNSKKHTVKTHQPANTTECLFFCFLYFPFNARLTMPLLVPLPERPSCAGTRNLGLWRSDIDQLGTSNSSHAVVNAVENASSALGGGLNVGNAQRVYYSN